MTNYPTTKALRAFINFLTWLLDADTTQKIIDIKTHFPKLIPAFNLLDQLKAKITSSKIVRVSNRFLFWFMNKDITEPRQKIDTTMVPALTPALALMVILVYLLFFSWLFIAIKDS